MPQWLKVLLNGALNVAKADVVREIDRALRKIENGETAAVVASELRQRLSALLAKAKLGGEGGKFLLDMVLAQVDWVGLLGKPAAEITKALEALKTRVQGARF